MADRYAVIGNPIAHSLSPMIHSKFAKLAQQDMSYAAILATDAEFNKVVQEFFSSGGSDIKMDSVRPPDCNPNKVPRS